MDPSLDRFDDRVLASVNVTARRTGPVTADVYGPGTHATSIAADVTCGHAFGIAPDSKLVIVMTFDGDGLGSCTDFIK